MLVFYMVLWIVCTLCLFSKLCPEQQISFIFSVNNYMQKDQYDNVQAFVYFCLSIKLHIALGILIVCMHMQSSPLTNYKCDMWKQEFMYSMHVCMCMYEWVCVFLCACACMNECVFPCVYVCSALCVSQYMCIMQQIEHAS